MTERMRFLNTPFGSSVAYPMDEYHVGDVTISHVYGQGLRMTWTEARPQQLDPTGLIGKVIIYWDDEETDPDGQPFTEANPIFEGFIREIQPGESNKLMFMALDPTHQCAAEVRVMSGPWREGNVSQNELPYEGPGTYPRLIFNATIDNDDDYAYSRADFQTTGQIIQTILEDAYHPLYWRIAAPGDGSDAGNGSAFVQADLNALDYELQEKIVFDSESVPAALDRLLQWEPQARMVWRPGARKWRFVDISQSATKTLTLNLFNAVSPSPDDVLSLNLSRSMEGRYTAVKYYGPQSTSQQQATTEDGSLEIVSSGSFLQNDLTSCCNVEGQNRWKIANHEEDGRRIARMLPAPYTVGYLTATWGTVETGVGGGVISYRTTRAPVLEAKFPSTSAGSDHWVGVDGWQLDEKTGEVYFPTDANGDKQFLYRYNGSPAGGEPNYENPDEVRFTYPVFADPITARFPSSGYDGTAFSIGSLQAEKKIYDEMLAVGFERGEPVTTANRVAAFRELARRMHNQTKDIIYTGGCTLDGLNWDFLWLDKQVNFAGVDADGNSTTTGWEAINAIVTSVEYDLENKLTTIQFSTDQAAMLGIDVEAEKRELKIRALQALYIPQVRVDVEKRVGFTELGTRLVGADVSIQMDIQRVFVDPVTGETEV